MGHAIPYHQPYSKPAEAIIFPQPVNYVSKPSYLKPEISSPYGPASVYVNPYDYPIPSAYPSAPLRPSGSGGYSNPNQYKSVKYIAPEIIPAVVKLPNYSSNAGYAAPSPPTFLQETYNGNPIIYKAPKPCSKYY